MTMDGARDGDLLPVVRGGDPPPDLSPLLDPSRLAHLERFGLRTSPPVAPLERLCRLAVGVLDADAASVTIVEDVQTTVASHQLELPADAVTVPLEESFCARAMVSGAPLPVPDASEHPWVRHTVAAHTGRTVGYLGIPLLLSDGHSVGALCVFSDAARGWTQRDARLLTELAASTATELELRVAATELATALVDTQTARARMEYAATHDALTGLANRVLVTTELTAALEETGDLALLYCDLDGFKAVNDRFGHAVGDALLVEVARRLRHAAGQQSLVARLGGDEFAIMARGSSPTLAARLAERLHTAVVAPYLIEGRRIEIGASFGVVTTALVGAGADDGDTLLAAADAAMFEAKAAAAAPVRLFDAQLSARHERRIATRSALVGALEAGALDLELQADVDLRQGVVVGVSVLVRFTDPSAQRVTSAEIVAAAGELGRLAELDAVVLDRIAALRRGWLAQQLADGLVIWTSATANQVVDAAFVDRLTRIAAEPGVPLGLAVTADVLTDAQAAGNLATLHAAGVRIAVEGFGVERASFAALHRIPLDLLRIDPALVARLDADPYLGSAVHVLGQLANGLGVELGADGVETVEVADLLRAHGCQRASGFLLARPLPDGAQLRQLLCDGIDLPQREPQMA